MKKREEIPADPIQGTPAQRNYKDTVFRMLYRDKTELLELYNAVNGTQYKNPEELEAAGLENAVYMSMKNDVSCVVDLWLNLYEHQSTVNPSMPLRDLFYIARLYEKISPGGLIGKLHTQLGMCRNHAQKLRKNDPERKKGPVFRKKNPDPVAPKCRYRYLEKGGKAIP